MSRTHKLESKKKVGFVDMRCGPPKPNSQPWRKFHWYKAIPFKQFKQELDAKERESYVQETED